MNYSSKEELDLSEYEIQDYSEKHYEQLKAVKYKVRNFNGTLRCPYCSGKKNLALAKYLQTDLVNEAEQIPRPTMTQIAIQSVQPVENYVWLWTGIIVNIKSEFHDSRY